jgi:hypothetical protein
MGEFEEDCFIEEPETVYEIEKIQKMAHVTF